MINADVYKLARENLLKKRQEIGYQQLVTDCWGMVVEFEKEWHAQNGGQTKVIDVFPHYDGEQNMRQAMIASNLDLEQLVHTLNWKHLSPDDELQGGDVAILTPIIGGSMRYSVYFYNDGKWEISEKESGGFIDLVEGHDARNGKYLLRKKHWSEKTKVVSNKNPIP